MRRHPLVLFCVLAACAKGSDVPEAARADSVGVEIVMNAGIDRPLDWPIIAEDTLLDPSEDTLLSGEARYVRAQGDDRGRLYFLDGPFNDRRVLVREPDGSARQVGRRGGGPGEYEMVGDIAAAPNGELLVMDYAKRAFVHFGPDGDPLPNLPYDRFGRGFPRSGGFAAGGLVVVLSDRSDSTAALQVARYTAGVDTVELARLSAPSPKPQYFESCKVGISMEPLYYPNIQWTGNTSEIAIARSAEYQIDIRRGARLVRSIRRAVAARPMTRALALQDLGEGMPLSIGGAKPCIIPASDIVEQRGFAPLLPAVKRLSMARDGTLWVERWTIKGEPIQRDVFDPTGNYLGTLTGDLPWPQTWLPDGDFVAVSADADSLPVVVRYAVGGAVRRE